MKPILTLLLQVLTLLWLTHPTSSAPPPPSENSRVTPCSCARNELLRLINHHEAPTNTVCLMAISFCRSRFPALLLASSQSESAATPSSFALLAQESDSTVTTLKTITSTTTTIVPPTLAVGIPLSFPSPLPDQDPEDDDDEDEDAAEEVTDTLATITTTASDLGVPLGVIGRRSAPPWQQPEPTTDFATTTAAVIAPRGAPPPRCNKSNAHQEQDHSLPPPAWRGQPLCKLRSACECLLSMIDE